MIATEVLDEALRGGEPARLLEERCKERLRKAEETVREAVASAPQFLAETKERHDELLQSAASLNTELEMLGESLDEITESSRQLLHRAKLEARKKEALDDLAVVIVPFVQVADALEQSDDIGAKDIATLERIHRVLEDAIGIAVGSGRPQLIRMVGELEERADESTAMMKSRYLDTFEIRSQTIITRGKAIVPGMAQRPQVGAASEALAKCNLLNGAIEAIVSELLRNKVADGISTATVFFESDTDDGCTLEWAVGGDASGELLEFDFDDIEFLSDDEVDAMSEQLDISNAVARALKVFDALLEHVVGRNYSRQLAHAMRQWFSEHVLPSSVVMSSKRGQYAQSGVPRDALRTRVAAASACAKVLQAAIRARGATSFVFVVEMNALEGKVGSECRAQAVLAARQAIGTFYQARHDDNEMEACPIAADHYVSREQRPPDYFPPCLVTRTAIAVHDVFLSTRKDAVNALQGGSTGIGNAMNAAAVECLRAYREDIPVQHSDDLRASLRLKALYYNDCMMFAHSSRLSSSEHGSSGDLTDEVDSLEEAAHKTMMMVRRTAEQRLIENLKAACRNGGLGSYGALARIQRASALSAAFNAMREVVSVFSDVIPTEIAELAAGRLLQQYLTVLGDEVAALPEISAEGCDQISGILTDADKNVETLMDFVKGMDVVRAGARPPGIIQQMRQVQKRLHAMREILNARMEDIASAYRSGKYQGLISREEVERFILAIFEDTPLRGGFIRDLDVSLEQEKGEWDNDNW